MTEDNGGEERASELLREGTVEAAAQLREIADSSKDKGLQKTCRKALYLLSQKKIYPAESHKPVESPQATDSESASMKAYVSMFDGAGNQLLCLTRPDPNGGKSSFYQIVINDLSGVRQYDHMRMHPPEIAKSIQRYDETISSGIGLVEIETDYAKALILRAREINIKQIRRTPQGFLDFLPLLAEFTRTYPESPIYASLKAEDIEFDTTFSRDVKALFETKWFENWFFDINEMDQWVQKWILCNKDDPNTTDVQNIERRNIVVREAASFMMTEALLKVYIRRLKESAEILRLSGKTLEAKQALYHALELKKDIAVSDKPFAFRITERSIHVGAQQIFKRYYEMNPSEEADNPDENDSADSAEVILNPTADSDQEKPVIESSDGAIVSDAAS